MILYDPDSVLARPGSDSLINIFSGGGPIMKAVGSSRVGAEYENFNNYMHNMPLAPGFVHAFEVRAGAPVRGSWSGGWRTWKS